jgi:hypothetical protein
MAAGRARTAFVAWPGTSACSWRPASWGSSSRADDLGLASFRGIPLATVDERLRAACAAAGIDTLG